MRKSRVFWFVRRGSNPDRKRRRLLWYPIPLRAQMEFVAGRGGCPAISFSIIAQVSEKCFKFSLEYGKI